MRSPDSDRLGSKWRAESPDSDRLGSKWRAESPDSDRLGSKWRAESPDGGRLLSKWGEGQAIMSVLIYAAVMTDKRKFRADHATLDRQVRKRHVGGLEAK